MESLLEFNIASGLAIKIENQNELTNKSQIGGDCFAMYKIANQYAIHMKLKSYCKSTIF